MAKRKKKIKVDLRKPAFKNGQMLLAKQLNDLWKDIQKLKRKLEANERTSTRKT